MTFVHIAIGLTLGFLCGFFTGVMRFPFGESAIAKECEIWRSKARAAQGKLRALRKLLEESES